MKNKKSETESKYKQMSTSLSVIVESFVLSEILKSEKRLQTADLKEPIWNALSRWQL